MSIGRPFAAATALLETSEPPMPVATRPHVVEAPAGRIIVVDDDRRMASGLAQWLCGHGHHAVAAGTASEGIQLLERGDCAACIVDGLLPADGARRVIAAVRAAAPRARIVVALPTTAATSALGTTLGPDAVIDTPIRDADLLAALRPMPGAPTVHAPRTREAAGGTGRVAGAACVPTANHAMLGSHPAIRRVLDIADRVATTPATVLITGESGTGKSLLARHLHAASRRSGRFVEVACGSLAESLLESELFGHVAGAFTGATVDRAGKFLHADDGTIFLDEIATASPALQVKLLRVLQEMQFEPVGGSRTCAVDARVILATNDDLAALVAAGRFRSDLFWRINVVTIEMPALRERATDIPMLADWFLGAAARKAGREVDGFTAAAHEALLRHTWPGNVRELEHAVERGVFLGRDRLVDVADLPPAVVAGGFAAGGPPVDNVESVAPIKRALAAPERQLILEALERAGWRRDVAARALGINRTTLYKKCKRLGLDIATVAPPR
jgi:DNA-binding NtrC family response regulator